MGVIYGLFDPREPMWLWEVRYIGQTIKTPPERLAGHVWEANRSERTSHTLRWMRKLLREGVRPVIHVLERCADDTKNEREILWIAEGRRQGWRLTNASDGGESNAGFKHTPESREKMRIARIGRVLTEEHKASAAEATQLARENDPTIYDRVSSSLKRFYADNPEERADISRRNTEWWANNPNARLERSQREIAYNQEHPEMVIRRNEAIRAGHLARDQSPRDCPECDAGPFMGDTGLSSHIMQKHNDSVREELYCECGDGPFIGAKGLNAHLHMNAKHDRSERLMCECGAGPFQGERGLKIHRTRFCELNKRC